MWLAARQFFKKNYCFKYMEHNCLKKIMAPNIWSTISWIGRVLPGLASELTGIFNVQEV
jgi:hypothetical protein